MAISWCMGQVLALCAWFCTFCHAVPQWSNLPQNPQVKQSDQWFQQTYQQTPQKFQKPAVQTEALDKCAVADYEQIQCGQPDISGAECEAMNCCFNGQQCYYGKAVTPPPPVAAPGPLRVELRLANGQCIPKGCAEKDEAYTSYYIAADYPVTKVVREPVYVEVSIMESTDPNIVLMLRRCWVTSTPSLSQWDILVDGCPYQDDRYLTTLVPVSGSSGLQFPNHYKRFIVKLFTFLDDASLAHPQETIFIHCSTEVCHPSSDSCVQSCARTHYSMKTIHNEVTVASSGAVTLVMRTLD